MIFSCTVKTRRETVRSIKAVHELGLERRETVRFISGVGVRALRGPFPSTRGPGRTHLWCASYRAQGKR
ncbi:hypothetical protein DEO72_LG6g81 [Vigna unguiculata]|uniref:Uncharacterized protein n=1 Tax=Vigna unguiculata TaxID=3917 RepID=A0A4D6M278_VIGUN|nr:hypothetical protein DEO72_LG6g81 [Vigna unguiculata]